jgi:hypothetical protein
MDSPVCRDYLKGACFRENCRYGHNPPDGGLPSNQASQPVCRDFQNGRCFRARRVPARQQRQAAARRRGGAARRGSGRRAYSAPVAAAHATRRLAGARRRVPVASRALCAPLLTLAPA